MEFTAESTVKYKHLVFFILFASLNISIAQNSVIQFFYNPGVYHPVDENLFSRNSWESGFSGELQYSYFLNDNWQIGAALAMDYVTISFVPSVVPLDASLSSFPKEPVTIITPKVSLGYKLGSSSYLLPTIKLGYSAIFFTGENEYFNSNQFTVFIMKWDCL